MEREWVEGMAAEKLIQAYFSHTNHVLSPIREPSILQKDLMMYEDFRDLMGFYSAPLNQTRVCLVSSQGRRETAAPPCAGSNIHRSLRMEQHCCEYGAKRN